MGLVLIKCHGSGPKGGSSSRKPRALAPQAGGSRVEPPPLSQTCPQASACFSLAQAAWSCSGPFAGTLRGCWGSPSEPLLTCPPSRSEGESGEQEGLRCPLCPGWGHGAPLLGPFPTPCWEHCTPSWPGGGAWRCFDVGAASQLTKKGRYQRPPPGPPSPPVPAALYAASCASSAGHSRLQGRVQARSGRTGSADPGTERGQESARGPGFTQTPAKPPGEPRGQWEKPFPKLSGRMRSPVGFRAGMWGPSPDSPGA